MQTETNDKDRMNNVESMARAEETISRRQRHRIAEERVGDGRLEKI